MSKIFFEQKVVGNVVVGWEKNGGPLGVSGTQRRGAGGGGQFPSGASHVLYGMGYLRRGEEG